ncbi:DUF2975 domain-containing protein [Nonlabens ponticola]|uniref:DUF2975 domain-containing protein n=1 Tax=Nonlabens ponticola TaxID=2496866 RepID=A0A3S9MVU2_9FLAO|nr:DUF2975 domain-containing protein [Nonlabens ponticola]AZQ43254.1 DUF2975 domain-containing protein [Nonlabens ponticola]
MKFLNLFIGLLKFLRFLLIAGCGVLAFLFTMDAFFDASYMTIPSESIIYIKDQYFSDTLWKGIMTGGYFLTCIMSLKACDSLIYIALSFKHHEYFTESNAHHFKQASIYYFLAFLVTPILNELTHLIEYILSSSGQLKVDPQFSAISLIKACIFGLFLYVMGEVIHKAVTIRKENDLTV